MSCTTATGGPAYSLARRICADDGIAEDVVQEVFLAFWRDPKRFDPERGSFGTWLLTLVHHKSVDAVRRESAIRRRTVPAAEDGEEWSAPPGPGADQAALGAVVAGQVRDALGQLPAEQRQALALAYYGGYTQREVATITGVPLGTVKSRMFTGVQRLRGCPRPVDRRYRHRLRWVVRDERRSQRTARVTSRPSGGRCTPSSPTRRWRC